MAIIAVTRGQQQPMRQEESDIDKLVKGLQIASGIFGIATNYQQLELQSLQKDKLKREAALEEKLSQGIITPEIRQNVVKTKPGDPFGFEAYDEATQTKDWFITLPALAQKNNMVQLEAQKTAKTSSDLLSKTKDIFDYENTLRTWRSGNEITKATTTKLDNFKMMLQGEKSKSTTGDLAMLYAFAKILDPGSVVREGEVKFAEQGNPWEDKINLWIKAATGEGRLADKVRSDMLIISRGNIEEQIAAQWDAVDSIVTKAVKDRGGSVDRVMGEYFKKMEEILAVPKTVGADGAVSGGFIGETPAYAAPGKSREQEIEELKQMFEQNQSKLKKQKPLIIKPALIP